MTQGVAGGFIVSTQYIGKKDVFPRAAKHGARFDLAQADLAQGEHTERLEQNTRDIFQRERNGTLVGLFADPF